MRPILVALTCLTLIPCLGGVVRAQPRPQMPALSAEQLGTLEGGGILVKVLDDREVSASAIGVIDASPETVRSLLEDFESTRLFVPAFSESRVVGHEGSFDLLRGRLETPWPMDGREFTFRTWRSEMTIEGHDCWVSAFDYVQGSGNLVDAYGQWLVIPWQNGRTLVQFEVTVELPTWLPAAVAGWARDRMLPSLIDSLRVRAQRRS